MTGSASSSSTQAVGSNTSHLLSSEPSTRFSLTSPPSSFSPLARTATTVSVTLPGMPSRAGPVTPEARSAVFVHVGWGSPASSDEEKLVDAACAGAASATALTTAAVIDLRTASPPHDPDPSRRDP